tara:strand:- start:1744 stop:2142 length:399 start_codon:yes stop_codon:yes gene_type:complete
MENDRAGDEKLSILIIDDSHSQRLLLQTFLKSFNVTEADSGINALKILSSEKFDLIICDFEMPEMSGLEFAKEIVNQGKTQGVPFIMCSANPPGEGSLSKLQEIISNSFWVEKSNKALSLRHLIDKIIGNDD